MQALVDVIADVMLAVMTSLCPDHTHTRGAFCRRWLQAPPPQLSVSYL